VTRLNVAAVKLQKIIFARAKDLAGMVEAVSEKLRRQAEYVEWWDRQPKAARNRYGHPGSGTAESRPSWHPRQKRSANLVAANRRS
jgi:hypothetical protein